jgi:hypothetical protein
MPKSTLVELFDEYASLDAQESDLAGSETANAAKGERITAELNLVRARKNAVVARIKTEINR